MKAFVVLLLPAINCFNASPSPDECREKMKHVGDCFQYLVPANATMEAFYGCFGEPKCQVTKDAVNYEMEHLDRISIIKEILSCINSNGYLTARRMCSEKFRDTDCFDRAATDCMLEQVLQAKDTVCTEHQLEKLKDVQKMYMELCQIKKNHPEIFPTRW